MNSTKIEILRDNEWRTLVLYENQTVKYNSLINKISSMNKREISHSNTLSIPYCSENIQALNLGNFNRRVLAISLNSKYPARIFSEGTPRDTGYVVINNVTTTININFIDSSLDLIEKWGSMTYNELLKNSTIIKPAEYLSTINTMLTYSMPINSILTPIPNISGKSYPLAKFPNSLNAVGEKFQLNEAEIRVNNAFNPYQSRPIFNAKVMLDIAIRSFGYSVDWDTSIDWSRIEKTYIVDKDLNKSGRGNVGETIIYPAVASNSILGVRASISQYTWITNFIYPSVVNAISESQLNPSHPYWIGVDTSFKDWKTLDKSIVVPNMENSRSGFLQWTANIPESNGFRFVVYSIWYNSSKKKYKNVYQTDPKYTDPGAGGSIDVVVDKVDIVSPESGYLLVGLSLAVLKTTGPGSSADFLTNMVYTENNLQDGVVSYDDTEQYETDTVDLLQACPNHNLKELISAYMSKEGMLISFDERQKTVKLFSYKAYKTARDLEQYEDWSDYLVEQKEAQYNTNFGNDYAKVNEFGLAEPFKGNSKLVLLSNQNTDSKFKDFAQNLNKIFKDVSEVKAVANTITPYFEFTNMGLGLVEVDETSLGTLTQVRADGSSQGTFSGLAKVQNVNLAVLPIGIKEWYDIIDKSVRCEAMFLLPTPVIKYLDLSIPIYVEKLGGFYIIESVDEYVDSRTQVKIKLIKLLD